MTTSVIKNAINAVPILNNPNTANSVVILDSNGKYPALDGSFITNLPSSGYPLIETPTLSVNTTNASLTTFDTIYEASKIIESGNQYQALSTGTQTVVHDSGLLSSGSSYNFSGKSGISQGSSYDIRGRQKESKFNSFSSWSNIVQMNVPSFTPIWIGSQDLTSPDSINNDMTFRLISPTSIVPAGGSNITKVRFGVNNAGIYNFVIKVFNGDNVSRQSQIYSINIILTSTTPPYNIQEYTLSTPFAVNANEDIGCYSNAYFRGFSTGGSIRYGNGNTNLITYDSGTNKVSIGFYVE